MDLRHRTTSDEDVWKTSARCNDGTGTTTRVFFSDQYSDILRAQAICRRCAVISQCQSAAKRRRENWGVWGGELFSMGQVRQVKARGRPPKRPRPGFVDDEAPLPNDVVEGLGRHKLQRHAHQKRELRATTSHHEPSRQPRGFGRQRRQ